MQGKAKKIQNALNNIIDSCNKIINWKQDFSSYNYFSKRLIQLSDEKYIEACARLRNIISISEKLKFDEKTIDENIHECKRNIQTIKTLMESMDVLKIMNAINSCETNDLFYKEKANDRKLLNELRSSFIKLHETYQKAIDKNYTSKSKQVIYNNEGNYYYIMKNYITSKYQNGVVYEQIEDDGMSEEEKYEVILYGLRKARRLCQEKKYETVRTVIDEMILKYEKLNKEYIEGKNHKFKDIKKNEKVDEELIEDTTIEDDTYSLKL